MSLVRAQMWFRRMTRKIQARVLKLACDYVAWWARENLKNTDFKISFGQEALDAPKFDVSLIRPARFHEDVMHGELHAALFHAKRLIDEKKLTDDLPRVGPLGWYR